MHREFKKNNRIDEKKLVVCKKQPMEEEMGEILGLINYWAVLVAGIVFWLIGFLWFSVIIGKSWAAEIQKHGIKLEKVTPNRMAKKSIWTLIFNLIVAFGVAIFVVSLGVHAFAPSLVLGLILGICFAAAVMIPAYLWESRSFKLSFYDIFYPFIGIVISSIIIGLWR